MIKVEIKESRRNNKDTLFNVYFEGKLILKDRRDPEFDACRYFRDLGMTGDIGFFNVLSGKLRAFIKDLVVGAQRCTIEGNMGIRNGKYVPFKEWT